MFTNCSNCPIVVSSSKLIVSPLIVICPVGGIPSISLILLELDNFFSSPPSAGWTAFIFLVLIFAIVPCLAVILLVWTLDAAATWSTLTLKSPAFAFWFSPTLIMPVWEYDVLTFAEIPLLFIEFKVLVLKVDNFKLISL